MIVGIICSLISALFTSVHKTIARKYLKKDETLNDAIVFARLFYGLPIFIVYAFVKGNPFPVIHQYFLLVIIPLIVCEVLGQYLYHEAITLEKVSVVDPIGSLVCIPTAIISFLFFSGWSWTGYAGILVITGGAYILKARTNNYIGGDVLYPIKSLWNDKASRLMLYTTLIWSITTTLQRVAVGSSNLEVMGICYLFGSSVGTILVGLNKGISLREIVLPKKVHLYTIIGLSAGVAGVLQYTALVFINPAYVLALKQTQQFWNITLGRVLLKEELTYHQIFAVSIIVIGAGIVGLGIN